MSRVEKHPLRRHTPRRRLAGQRDSPRARRRNTSSALLDWVVRYAVPLTGITGAILYGVLRLSYVLFYLPLRATPEEVGYDYAEILAGQLIGAIELVLVFSGLFFGVGMAVIALAQAVRRSARRTRADRMGKWRAGQSRRLAARSVVVATAAVAVALPFLAWYEGGQAAEGHTRRNMYLYPATIPVLPVQAVPATVELLGTPSLSGSDLESRQCLMYLGQADGTAVFYDVMSRESLRLGSEAIVVSLQFTTGVPLGCNASDFGR